MTVAELIEQLEALPLRAEVRLAVQPGYPLAYSLDVVTPAHADGRDVVWLAAGSDQGYATRAAWGE